MNPIDQFVKRYELRSMSTVRNYRSALNHFFVVIQKDPNTYFDVKDKDVYQKDIETYHNSIIKKAPKTRESRLFCLKSFFMRNGIDIPTFFWKDLNDMVHEKGSITEDEVPKLDQLQKILNHANQRERAWILFSACSGARIGEILSLTFDKVKLDEDPVKVYISGMIAKKGYKRITFITQEAKAELIKWLDIRQKYLDHLKEVSYYAKNSTKDNSNLIFPFSYNAACVSWIKLLKKAGLCKIDSRTNRVTMGIHSARKYAKTRLEYHMPRIEADYLVGHKGYLSMYDRPEIEKIAQSYKKAEPYLSFFIPIQTTKEIDNLNKKIIDQNKKIEEMYQLMEKMTGTLNRKFEKDKIKFVLERK